MQRITRRLFAPEAAVSRPLPGASPHAMRPLRRPTSERTEYAPATGPDVVAALRANNPRGVWMAYKSVMLNTATWQEDAHSHANLPPLVHSAVLSSLVQHLIPSVAVVHAEMVIMNLKSARIPMSLADYNNLITIYMRNGDLRSLMDTFQSLLDNTYPALRNRVSAIPVPAHLASLPLATPPRKITPNTRSFHLVLTAYANAGRVSETAAILEQMHAFHPTAATADPVSLSIMISAHANSSRRSAEDLKAIRHILDSSAARSQYGFTDRRILDAAVRGLGLCGDFEGAKELFESYESKYGVAEYSLESIDAMMAVCEVHGDLEMGEGLLADFFNIRRRKDSGSMSPSTGTTNNQQLSKKRIFVMPLLSTVKALMKLNLAAGNSVRVLDLFHRALRDTQLPDRESYEIVIRCYLNDGHLDEAERFFEKMHERGHKVNQELLEAMETARETAKVA
ncbi:hypothetical protein HDU81_002773 [Chytriomyces hyalinus]|nr:hypothetical protein HDU81_002773 [Chytriomyces hyalinus]